MKQIRWFILIPIGLLPLFGCSTNHEVRQLATHVNSIFLFYENIVDEKVQAEKAFYKKQSMNMNDILLGQSKFVDITVGVNGGTATTNVEKTFMYGRNRVAMERDARIAAENYVIEGTNTFQTIINFVDEGVAKENKVYLEVFQRQNKLKKDLIADLEKIDQQKEQLAKIRKQLTILATKPSVKDEGENLVKLGQAIQNSMSEEGKKSKAKDDKGKQP